MTDDELRLKHLSNVQEVITRLSQYSFIIRGWSVTLTSILSAIVGVRIRAVQDAILAITLIPALMFWGLDAYYLRRERLFRRLHAAIASNVRSANDTADIPLFCMDVRPFEDQVSSLVATLFVGHVAAIPAMLVALCVTLYLIAN